MSEQPTAEQRVYWRFALAWLLYWFGSAAYWFIDHDRDVPWRRWHHLAFRLYNFGMCNSNLIQGEPEFGPWKRVK
jgi:hypothetical protein